MRFAIRYICIFASLLICCSCNLEELKLNNPSESTIDFIARPADYSNVDVATKSEPTDAFETAIYTAYLLLFDASNNRIYFSEVDPQSRLQRVTLKGLSTVTACFVANVAKADIEGITTLDALNSVVLNLKYATYSEAGGHLGVPMLAVNDTDELCFPMVGVKTLDVSQISQAIEIPLTRLFAKVSVELKMNISNLSDATRFELLSYKLVNLPLKVRLLPQDAESAWVSDGGSFAGENSHVASNINHKIYNESYSFALDAQKKYSFDVYVPEYQLESLPSNTENYGKPEYKPIMYDYKSKKAVHIVLSGSYIPREGSSSNLDYSVFLGNNESTNFTLNRNTHYNNYLTIKGITKKADNTDAALVDHRVKKSDGDMVSMFGEVANCYIISKEGEYRFPAYKGAFKADQLSKEYLCNGNRAEIIYRSNTTDIVFEDEDGDGNLINVTTDIDGTKVIGFKLSKVNAEDNIIIAIYDSNGDIEWSWHLWFVTGLKLYGDKYFQIDPQTMPNGKQMMDRNLGVITEGGVDAALAGTLAGLYYKYGHRGPFIGTKYWDDDDLSVDYSYAWAGKQDNKSRTDPCPPGYRVPYYDDEDNIWETGQGKIGTSQSYFVYSIADPNITYRYSGYLYKDSKNNQFKSNNSVSGEGEFNVGDYTYHNPFEDRSSTTNETGGRWDRNKTRTKITHKTEYYNIKYYAKTKSTMGGFWCSGNNIFRYEYGTIDWSQITQNAFSLSYCETRSYDVCQDQKSSNYGVTWSDVGNERIENEVFGEKKSGFSTTMAAAVFLEVNGIDLAQSDSRYTSGNAEHGYQVRCVKE